MKRLIIHTPRHSFAAHSFGRGTDQRDIQELLGHSAKTGMEKRMSPLDDLDIE